MNILYYIKRIMMALTALALAASCDSFVYEDEGDCAVHYRLKFRYDMNLKFADAFAHEVKSVRLYAFNEADELVWQGTERGNILASGDYVMTLPLNSGKYRLVAWCGLDNEPGGERGTFSLPDISPVCTPQDLHCRLDGAIEAKYYNFDNTQQPLCSKKDLYPLFHGIMDVELPENVDGGEYTYEMSLTKNTNVFRIVLQHLSGEDIHPEDFDFSIEDENGWLAYDNLIYKEQPVVYLPWALYSGEAGVGMSGDAITNVKVAVAELTVNRLFARSDWTTHKRPMLTIRVAKEGADKGKLVVSIPIIDYALLVKGEHHRQMDDQEYLDRADEYNMTFFLDANNNWISTVIQVLSWRVVVNNEKLN